MKKNNKKMFFRVIKIISLVMLTVFIIGYMINNFIVQKYYIFSNNYNINTAYKKLKHMDLIAIKQNSQEIEDNYGVNIIWFKYIKDELNFNDELRLGLNKKRITLSQIWLVEDAINKIDSGEVIKRLYNQDKLESSYLAYFFKIENDVIVIGKSIPHSDSIINIFNILNFALWFSTFLFLVIFMWWYIKKVTKPIESIEEQTKQIANLKFSKININTGDELEQLANSINSMSTKLKFSLNELDNKNSNLKTFISDISHEMKTPLSLIRVYSQGIEDGIDDGTYLKGIIKETDKLNYMINYLLELSRLEKTNLNYTNFSLNELLKKIIKDLNVMALEKELNIIFDNHLQKNVIADKLKMEIVFKNIINNAIKYSVNKEIIIELNYYKGHVIIKVSNNVDENFDSSKLKSIFNPFYVIEESRNKDFSGHGLGLSIVKNILDKHMFKYDVKINNNKFVFTITM